MSGIAIAVLVVVGLPILGFVIWQGLQECRVRIESGTVGLLLVRGVATERALEPGAHYVRPYRQSLIQIYPLRDQTYLVDEAGATSPAEHVDPPLHLHLGDRTAVTLRYTIRYRIIPASLRAIHERVGPEGITALVRDRSRQVLVDQLSDPSVGYGELFGEGHARLQTSLASALSTALEADGFTLELFSLRDVDLGELGTLLQATAQGGAELEREQAAAAVRLARVRNEREVNAELADGLAGEVLRYRQVELWREFLQRWDGRMAPGLGPSAAATGVGPAPPPSVDAPEPPAEHLPPPPA